MPKKNPPAKKRKIFSLMNEKHCDEIYETLQDMMSSEEDDDEDLGEELNDRLDYIQNIVTDHDMYEILSAPVDDQISAVNSVLPPGSPPIDVPIPGPGVQLPASSSPIDEPMPDPDVYLPPIDAPMPDPDVHLPSSSLLAVVPISDPDIHLPPSSTNQSRNQPSRSMSTRPSYVEVQNRNWEWTNDIEDFDSPIFDRPMTVRKIYSNRSQPKDYFMDMCPEEAMDLIVENTYIYAQTNHSKNWIDITKVELFAYFGITILMSVNPLSDYQLDRLGRSMIDSFSSRTRRPPVFKNKKGGVYGVPDELRLSNVGNHMPRLNKFRRCRFCSTHAKEVRLKYICSVCEVPLCPAPCFERFHGDCYVGNNFPAQNT